jgi:hypothetical protein
MFCPGMPHQRIDRRGGGPHADGGASHGHQSGDDSETNG